MLQSMVNKDVAYILQLTQKICRSHRYYRVNCNKP